MKTFTSISERDAHLKAPEKPIITCVGEQFSPTTGLATTWTVYEQGDVLPPAIAALYP